jgi:cytochrome P450
MEVNDRRLRAGTTIILDLAAANRDPKVFDEPTRFRLDPARATVLRRHDRETNLMR